MPVIFYKETVMTDEQKAAFIMAQAAVLNAKIWGMITANIARTMNHTPLIYNETAFLQAINESSCDHDDVISFFHS